MCHIVQSMQETKTKEENTKANEHQQEVARQAAKGKKEEEHKTEVDRLGKKKNSIDAAAGVVRKRLEQVEANVEKLL